jgi:(p)ppGpp synthase/HD superfamily hydrolase
VYSPGIEKALRVAVEAHTGQYRKGTESCPYAVHPVHVALMLARLGMDEDVVQAGILHDVVEDCPEWTVARISAEFSPRVARIVGELTEDKSRPWEERKRHGIEALAHMSADAAAVKAVDKLHNLESLRVSLSEAQDPDRVWARFTGGRAATMRMAAELVTAIEKRVSPALGRSLRKSYDALRELVEAQTAQGAASK